MPHLTMRFPEGRKKALTLSYDDAVTEDIRLIDIMVKHGLKGTFNINTAQYVPEGFVYPEDKKWGRRMEKGFATRLYAESGMEPAIHAYTHPHLEMMPLPQATYEIGRCRADLEEQFGCIIRGGAYPYGTYNDETVAALEACGIVYCRTVENTNNFSIPTDWLRMPATCHHRSDRLPELTRKFLEEEPRNVDAPWLFYLWGHSYEFERDNNWEIIEAFAEKVGGREEIWYATNIEVYDYIKAWNSLQYTMDFSQVYNPTATKLWLLFDNRSICVAPGETVKLR